MGMLCQGPLEQNSTYQVLTQMGVSYLDGVYCIGSHDCIQADTFNHFGAQYVYNFECNELVYPYLLQRIAKYPNHRAFLEGLGDIDGQELEFFYYREKTEGASSFFQPDLHLKYHPSYVVLPETKKITLHTLDTIIEKYQLQYLNASLIDIDVQGMEIAILSKAQKLLQSPYLQYIVCEVSTDMVYKETSGKKPPLIQDVDDFLSQYGFVRRCFLQEWEIQGSAGYSR